MDWPEWVQATALFPSLEGTTIEGLIPVFDEGLPAWALLDPASPTGIKQQLIAALEAYSGSTQDPTKSGATVDTSQGRVVVDASATVEPSSHLIGPCYVGPSAEVRHGAYVRPFSWICSGGVVGHNTEIKHSVLLPGAKAPHFNYVGDSILGKNVNLGAGTKLSNLRNDGGEVHIRHEGARIASGLRKFGAVLGEGCQLGCNSVTNPGTVLGQGSVVWPNATVTGLHPEQSTHR